MRKFLPEVLALVFTALAILGVKAVRSHATTLREELRSTVRGATPAEYEANRIRVLIGDLSKDVLGFADKISETEGAEKALRDDIHKLEARLAGGRADLLTERNLLAQPGEVFTIRGTAYSRAQVEASAQARIAQMQRDQATLETKRQAAERLKEAVREGRARLQEAVVMRDTKLQELDLLVADLANAELRQELEALAAPLRDGVLSPAKNELAASMKAFSKRVREAGRHADASAQLNAAPALISHDAAASPAALVEQIDRLLAPAAAAPAAGP